MIIDPSNINKLIGNSLASGANKAKGDTGSSPAPQAASANPDNVSLSSQAKVMARLEQEVNKSSGVNVARVAELKTSIADGRYPIDNDQIAQKMVDRDDDFPT